MLRRFRLSLFCACAFLACGEGTEPSNSIVGAYLATVLRITPTGQATIDALAGGGVLAITIASNNVTSGTLNLPASVTGGAHFNANMAGTASVTGSTVTFQQAADSFVRDLIWTRGGTELTVSNQVAGSAAFTITLTRQ